MDKTTPSVRRSFHRESTRRWLAVTALGWMAMTLGLFIATVAGNAVRAPGGADNTIAVVQAVTAALLIVPAVYLIQRRFRLAGRLLPVTPAAFLHLLSGGALVLLLGGMGFMITGALGWTNIISWHFSVDLLIAVAFNICIAFLYEALPEELSMRGIVYSGLRLRLPAYAAYGAQVLLFVILQRNQRLLTYNELEAGTGPVVIQFGIIIIGSAVLLALFNLLLRRRRLHL